MPTQNQHALKTKVESAQKPAKPYMEFKWVLIPPCGTEIQYILF